MKQTENLFSTTAVADIVTVLKKEKCVRYDKKKFPLSHVMLFRKGNSEHALYIPMNGVSNSIEHDYLSIRPITVDAKGCHLGERISGLALMPFFCGGVKPAIEKYNNISKDIGDYSLFGKIEAIVSLVDGCVVNF